MFKAKGNAFIFGDNIDTDQILPGFAMSYPKERLHEAALTGSAISNFPQLVKEGDIIIGGLNFGCGSSREQAPVALKDSKVSVIVAKNFAMIFRKNSINIGLPVMTCDEIDNIKKDYKENDEFFIDIENAILKNETQNIVYNLNPMSKSAFEIIASGGLMEKVKKRLGIS